MTHPPTLSETSSYLDTLTQAVAVFRGENDRPRPDRQAVVEALLQAEKAAKQQHLTYSLEQLAGEWRLYFTAPRNVHQKAGVAQGKGFYVPQFAPAQISFLPNNSNDGTGTIGNQIGFGPLMFRLNGPLKYPGKKNLLGFDFTQAEFSVFGKALYKGKFGSSKRDRLNFEQLPISKLPFFAFFLVTETFIAARGRGGGLAIWVKTK